MWRARPVSGGGLRRISCGMPMPVQMAREGAPLIVIQRQLGHINLGITSQGRGAVPALPPVLFTSLRRPAVRRRLLTAVQGHTARGRS
jgi:hypothetical protein